MILKDNNDLYTINGSSNGNGALTYPIGLITMDEIVYAGGSVFTSKINSIYFLSTGQYYWTMTPKQFFNGGAWGYFEIIGSYGGGIGWNIGVRPVINLRSDVTISSGDGTASNPYVIET